jgi:two-component SAPR family response regulator
LAGSVLAEVTTLIGLGVPDQAFLGHRLHVPVADDQRAFESAREAVGSTASADLSTFELRSRAGAGDVWEPAVVLVGSGAGAITPPRVRTGVAVVSASPIHGPSSRLAPDGDAWTLLPLGLRLVPIGLWPADVAAIAELVEVGEPVGEAVSAYRSDSDDTITVQDQSGRPVDGTEPGGDVDRLDSEVTPGALTPVWDLMVRLLGPVEVVSTDGTAVSFERSKTRELVAWLATHRRRSTRSAARTALWELDVRDATFANVVSEARRSLARLVEPPSGEEWVGRTMTDDLPLHDLVCADVDLVEHALDVARLQPPAQAIATLSPAVDLISGMPFEGTAYLWPDPEGLTSNLVLLATSAAAELAGHCLSIGDINGVFHATGRGLTVLRGHEELIGLRMQAHARAGDHAGVRQEWESYERVITSDPWSDGEPSPKLVELRRQLLNPSR